MAQIDNNILAFIRQHQNENLPENATVIHNTVASDGMGGYSISGCSACAYAARLREPRADERPDPSRYSEFSTWRLTLPHDAAVSASDTIVVDSRTYRVLSVDEPKSWNTALRCMVELVR